MFLGRKLRNQRQIPSDNFFLENTMFFERKLVLLLKLLCGLQQFVIFRIWLASAIRFPTPGL